MPEVATRSRADLFDRAAARLRRAGVIEPRREALQLAEAAWRRSTAELLLQRESPVEPAAGQAFDALVARRASGEPLSYVIGTTGFRYLTLTCDSRALIPRPETEMLVDLVLERVSAGVAVDAGTGTGCLALSLAREGSFERVLAIERCPDALSLARENATRCGTAVDFVRGDFAGMLRPASVDALVANPPYLTTGEYSRLDPSVAHWEPVEALASGADGLEATRRLVAQGQSVVRAGGWLALEADAVRADHVADIAHASGFFRVEVIKDLFERKRYVLAQRRA